MSGGAARSVVAAIAGSVAVLAGEAIVTSLGVPKAAARRAVGSP